MINKRYDYVLGNVCCTSKRFIDKNKSRFHQFLQFLIVNYLIDSEFITLYRRKDFEISPSSPERANLQSHSQNREIL